MLTRGRSIDSVDRPFHPSDWVDVNLEVPSPPRADSTLTNSIVDTSLRPAVTPTFNCKLTIYRQIVQQLVDRYRVRAESACAGPKQKMKLRRGAARSGI